MAKILIVDDDSTIIELLSVRLRTCGHQVIAAMDGASGPMLSTTHRPDLIILDYSMPAANGAKVLERMRGCTFTVKTPILVLTASPLEQVAAEMGEDRHIRFMRKPVDFPRFNSLIAELLGLAPPDSILHLDP